VTTTGYELLGDASDIVLAGVAAFVASRFLRGYRCEAAAGRTTDPETKAVLHEKAQQLYSLNAFQSPLLLYLVFFGCIAKIASVAAPMIGLGS
jgi:hypothetical protein